MNFNRYVEISRALFNPKEHTSRTFHTTFILRSGKIVSIGVNSNKSHTRNLLYDYKARDGKDIRHIVGTHSEMSSIIKYGREDCSDCSFVNIRLDKQGILRNSRPCSGCTSIFRQIGYKRIYFTNQSGQFEEMS